VRRFGGLCLASSVVWAVFSGVAEWAVIAGSVPGSNVLQLAALSWKIAVASFAGTIVCLAIQWSERLDGARRIDDRWRQPDE
jgi:membrane protein implicated in regulation of membrane protease activity